MQFSSQGASVSPHVGLLGVQGAGLVSVSSTSQQQPTPILQQSSQHPLVSTGTKDGGTHFFCFFSDFLFQGIFLLIIFLYHKADAGHCSIEEQQQHNESEDLIVDPASSPSVSKITDDDVKTSYAVGIYKHHS